MVGLLDWPWYLGPGRLLTHLAEEAWRLDFARDKMGTEENGIPSL
jgi:hypothetical protein